MAGDQDVAPPNAKVKRDAQGRIVEVVQELSLARDDPDAPAYSAPGEVDGLTARLSAACDWLTARNIALARDWGIGLERDYTFDQEAGRLVLKFGGRRTIAAQGQILGSFDPRDHSFMWSWANPSIRPELCEDAARLKTEGERLGVAALTTPVQTVTFDDLLPLLALAAQDGGADGVYRCMVNGSTSLFVALRLDEAAPKGAGDSADGLLEAAHALAADYDREMLPIDRDHHLQGKQVDLGDFIERKMAIYRRYWSRDDDYWEPCSVGWPSSHDQGAIRLRFTVPHPMGGALDIAIGKNFGQTIYRIEQVESALKITDQLIDWGDGFIWPTPPDGRS
ncbi:DUF6882 domain-containing protein [Sphingomonas suaedae]|uniref:DUF6882 domain-containing protein n=1 Tax=Sphingomonas suaedae TaxID=2599297 RepID=UPI0016491D80|nr:DUF6882 domain-containing protein [Sphingomonas suaedae]